MSLRHLVLAGRRALLRPLPSGLNAHLMSSKAESAAELTLISVLRKRFPQATDIAVVDVSGGCGSMYEVYVEAPEFANTRVVKQHQMVTEALKAEIREMHGIRVSTAVSKAPKQQ